VFIALRALRWMETPLYLRSWIGVAHMQVLDELMQNRHRLIRSYLSRWDSPINDSSERWSQFPHFASV